MPEEKEIPTSAGMETPTQTVERIKSQLNVVPIDALEQPGLGLTIPEPDVDTLAGTASAVVPEAQSYTDLLSKQMQAEQQSLSSVQQLMGAVEQRGEVRQGLMAEVSPIQDSLRKINERIARRTARLEKFDDMTFLGEEEMRAEAAGRDITKGAFGAKARERRLQRAIERTGAAADIRADMAEAEYLQGNIDSAIEQIDLALDAQFQPLEQELQFEQFMLTRAMERADSTQKGAIAERQAEVERQQGILDDANELVKAVAASGFATPQEISGLVSSDLSPEEKTQAALEIMARGSQEQLAFDQAVRRGDFKPGVVAGGSIESGVGSLMASQDLGTEGDPMIDVLKATAGGRALTQSETEPLTNARRVINQLDNIVNQVVAAETGPILGIVRSNNPYDVKARELEASLIALVPQLARGIYGEVGVLTDTDVERYVRTLPNIQSTEQVNQAVTALTLRNVRSAFVAQLESMAAAGRDVSGFVGIYEQLNNKINSLEAGLNMGSRQDFEDEFESFDTAMSTNNQTDQGGVLGTIGRFLFGS